jgi:hypothetical protein
MKHRIVRLALGGSLLLAAAPLAGTSHAVYCNPAIDDVCATYGFACQRLERHNVYLALCHLN